MQRTTNQVNTIMDVDNEIHRIAVNDPSLNSLDLSSQNLSSNQIRILGEALNKNTNLTQLKLNQFNIAENSSVFIEVFERLNFNTTLSMIQLIRDLHPVPTINEQDVKKIKSILKMINITRNRLMQLMTKDKEFALFEACKEGYLPLVKQLIENDGLNPNSFDTITELQENYINEDNEVKCDEKSIMSTTVLGTALANGQQEVAKYLLTQRHKLITINNLFDGRTPLMIACDMGDVNSVKLILSYPNVDVKKKYTHNHDKLKHTALTDAALGYLKALESNEQRKINNYKTIIQLLLEHHYTAECLNLVQKGVAVQARSISSYYLDFDLEPVINRDSGHLNQLLEEIYRLNQDMPNEVIFTYATKLINKNFDWGKNFSFFSQQNPSVNRETYYCDTEIRFTV